MSAAVVVVGVVTFCVIGAFEAGFRVVVVGMGAPSDGSEGVDGGRAHSGCIEADSIAMSNGRSVSTAIWTEHLFRGDL